MTKPKYYCHLNEGRTKGDDMDIKTLHYIQDEITKLSITNFDKYLNPMLETKDDSFADVHGTAKDTAYAEVSQIIIDIMNREIGT